jgi:amino acid transporter
MAREKVLPALLTRNWSSGHSPRSAIITMSIANSIFLLLTLLTGSVAEALTNVVASLGLMSVVFYGLTAAAALWHARRSLASSWRSAISGGALPAVGVAGMIYVAIESIRTHALSKTALMYGGGAMFAGFACALVLHRVGNQPFFMSASRSRSTPWSDDRD